MKTKITSTATELLVAAPETCSIQQNELSESRFPCVDGDWPEVDRVFQKVIYLLTAVETTVLLQRMQDFGYRLPCDCLSNKEVGIGN